MSTENGGQIERSSTANGTDYALRSHHFLIQPLRVHSQVLSVLGEPVSPRWSSVFDVGGSGGYLTPVGERYCAAPLKRFPVDEMAFQIEMIVDVGVDRGELL